LTSDKYRHHQVNAAGIFERFICAGNAIATMQSLDSTKVITVRTTGFDVAAAPRLINFNDIHYQDATDFKGAIVSVTKQANLILS